MQTLKNIQGKAGREQSLNHSYHSIPMFCDEELHEVCFSFIKSIPKDANVLILGSGGGAFDQRMVDSGFTHITSLDFRPDFFRATGTTFIERDLNQDFNDLGTFDLIIAIELIEHLENPAHFLRNASSCLSEHGKLIVTTPNIESGPSRAAFLMQGTLSFFTIADMHGSGHISPLLHHIFAFHVKNARLYIQAHSSNRNAWSARFYSNIRECLTHIQSLQLIRAGIVLIKTCILFVLWPLTLIHAYNGNIHVYVLRK
jgi:2-polyprenyl-3-methyl-5-hydroxy-6-metoxy-1,4-benzoquinol methylase